MKRKIFYIVEVMLFLWVIVFMHHYDNGGYITTLRFELTNYPSVRTLLDLMILGIIIFRIMRLSSYWDDKKLKVQTDHILWVIFVLCTIPDIWLYAKWVYYTNTYWLSFFIWISPSLVWLINLRIHYLNQNQKSKFQN